MILHVNSSLPRSGSELMQALLAQHPDVYASATSPLLEYWFGAQANYGMSEVKSQDPELMQQAFGGFCKHGAEGYYGSITRRPVVIDKSRGWLEHADLLWRIFPDAKIVSMIRPIEDIVGSLERVYRANPGHPETRHLPKTAKQRAQYWQQSGSLPLGLALDRLRDRQARGEDERILYVGYNALCKEPITTMHEVFKHLNLPTFDIDPDNVKKSSFEDDSHYGIFGCHNLRKKVSKR